MTIRVIDTILQPALIQSMQAPQEDESRNHHEKRMVSIATLIVNLMKDTVIKIQKHQIRDLDANPRRLRMSETGFAFKKNIKAASRFKRD